MKVGIKKIQENEWLVHIGCGVVKMDQFSVALLNITLEHLLALEKGEQHSTLDSYVKLGLRIKSLTPIHMQKLLRTLDSQDLIIMMMLAQDKTLNELILSNIGSILAKQIEADLLTSNIPEESEAKESLRRIVEKTFELEALGEIEFISSETRYI
ncbi:FliG C-terminal domain-containing protein [Thiomicrorhabdus sp. Milos-T2]|uniref:FliG C-terminal domain-containing protein n=1 Tax=Thiomicrorhabdus sp. Milos-T2 TaxID=90814 RepID=UPI0004948469|nr:FliG C-terminal domain-containing protein [Thiomicrorhabdus sp. Milos-T2]